jgi:hypothetical protein
MVRKAQSHEDSSRKMVGASSAPGSANSAETIYIHVMDSRVGVIAYYAVLAFPKRSESAKRATFSHALTATWMKAFAQGLGRKNVPTFYTSFKNEKIWTTLRLGLNRLARRLGAGTVGWSLMLSGTWEASGPHGIVEVAIPGPSTLDQAMRSYVGRHRTDQETETAVKNATHRVWAESLPVLHLAMNNPIVVRMIEARLNSDVANASKRTFIDGDLLNSIHEPLWLRESLESAEELRRTLGDRLGTDPHDPLGRGFKLENALRLLPAGEPSFA